MNGADILIKQLEELGIEHIAGIPGGNNLPIYHALGKSKIQHILARHEQGAGFIAQGMARATGKPAVCFATSGPGATNLVTALADAHADSVPVIAITGQVPTGLIGTNAFQEVDICAICKSITKKTYLVSRIQDITSVLSDAWKTSMAGRPGPVLIDIPKDIQLQEGKYISQNIQNIRSNELDYNEQINQVAQVINSSRQPVIYMGGGVTHSGAQDELLLLAEKSNIPVASTLMGLGNFPTDNKKWLGMLGMHGRISTNQILHRADLLLAFGVRFDDRATGKLNTFCPDARVVHIDIDTHEISKLRKADYPIHGDLKLILRRLIPQLSTNNREAWWETIDKLRQADQNGHLNQSIKDPIALIKTIEYLAPEDAIVTTDVGQHQMWVAQHYNFNHSRQFLTSGGLGTMGFGLPAAIGAALVNNHRKVLAICGDGSLLMNNQELITLAELGLDVTVLVLNNGQLGLVRQQQDLFYNNHRVASDFSQKTDFTGMARNFGLTSFDLSITSEPVSMLQQAIDYKGPCLVNCPVDDRAMVLPMVPPGAGNTTMIGESEKIMVNNQKK